MKNPVTRVLGCFLTLFLGVGILGCASTPPKDVISKVPVHRWAPKEMARATMPEYEIETRDMLWVEVARLVPKSPYKLKTFDGVYISAVGLLDQERYPINRFFRIQLGGVVELGHPYGPVAIAGMTTEEAASAIQLHLSLPL